jgi:hypothetical protein
MKMALGTHLEALLKGLLINRLPALLALRPQALGDLPLPDLDDCIFGFTEKSHKCRAL